MINEELLRIKNKFQKELSRNKINFTKKEACDSGNLYYILTDLDLAYVISDNLPTYKQVKKGGVINSFNKLDSVLFALTGIEYVDGRVKVEHKESIDIQNQLT
jgi:hypothetical protein